MRDGAIIALTALTGLRRGELIALDYASVELSERDDAGGALIVRGKGNKDRKAFIYSGAALAMADWLTVRGHEPGSLFVPINKGGVLQLGKRLGRESLRKMLNKRVIQAGIDSLTWHDFRRTFAGNLLDAGVDLATVQALMGHSSPVTTSRYDRRGEQVRRRAVQKLFVPYVRRTLSDFTPGQQGVEEGSQDQRVP
jgi:site-specific recombinase XerD